MNNKPLLSRVELEFTQKFQLHFPCGVIPSQELEKWIGCKADFLAKYISKHFSKFPAPERIWREENGVIYFNEPFVSPGITGPAWYNKFKKQGKKISDDAKFILHSSDFKIFPAGTATEIAVLKGELFSDEKRITESIRESAYAGTFTSGKKLFDPNSDIGCMIRERCTDEEIEAMGLSWIVAMHEPIKDSDGGPRLLGANRDDSGSWLTARYDFPGNEWLRGGGFAFVVSQVCP